MTQHGSASGDWYGARLAGIAIALTLSTGLAAGAHAAGPQDAGKAQATANGGPGPEGNPGSPRAQQVRSDSAPARERSEQRAEGRKLGASKGRKVRRRGASGQAPSRGKQKPAEARGNETPPPQAKAGKTTICHSTGSETNPYVEITVSNNALDAHGRHHDGADIIPAPEAGCEAQGAATLRETARDRRVADVAGRSGERKAERNAERKSERPVSGVLAAQASRPAGERDVGSIAEEEDDDDRSLPFTGLALLGILGTAALALGAGAAARRAAGRVDA